MESIISHNKFQISSQNLSSEEFDDLIKNPKSDPDFEQNVGEMFDKAAKFDFCNNLFYQVTKNGVNLNLFSKFFIGKKLNSDISKPTWISFSYISCGALEGCSCTPNKEFVPATPAASGIYRLLFNDCLSKIKPKFTVEIHLEIISFATLKNKKVIGTKNGVFNFSYGEDVRQIKLTDFCLFPSGKYCNSMTGIWRAFDNVKDFAYDFGIELQNILKTTKVTDNQIEPIFSENKVPMLEKSKSISKGNDSFKAHQDMVDRVLSGRSRR
jgi:hypothetical protein